MEKPKLCLGEHGEWLLGDLTDSREAAIGEAIKKLHDVESQSEITTKDFALAVGGLCEAACENGSGIAALLVALSDEEKHGDKALGAKALRGASDFIFEWYMGEATAGEG
jgi:hypothetical protein